MIEDMLGERIRDYGPSNAIEQENVLQELLQHFVLAGLSRAGLFQEAAFQGGTCLRILFHTNRFSENLDFLLKKPSPEFVWEPYLEKVRKDCEDEGIVFEVQDRSKAAAVVQKAFLKNDSIGQVLLLNLPYSRRPGKKIRIKLEIDTNPPQGSRFETRYISFPQTAAITVQELKSGFANKSHALLCRKYTKGRDWYDFLWYVSKKIVPDLELLRNALHQQGPWEGENLKMAADWFLDAMAKRIEQIDWDVAREDVARFIQPREQDSLALWGRELFLDQLSRLKEILERRSSSA